MGEGRPHHLARGQRSDQEENSEKTQGEDRVVMGEPSVPMKKSRGDDAENGFANSTE